VPRSRAIAEAMEGLEAWPIVYQDDACLVRARADLPRPIVDRRGEDLRGRFPHGELW
jgi:hypothetical protein